MKSKLVSAVYTRILARRLSLSDDELKRALISTSLTIGDIYGDTPHIELNDQFTIIENIVNISSNKCPGLTLGETLDLSHHGLIGIAALSSNTLLDALLTLTKFYLIRAPFFDFVTTEREDYFVIQVKTKDDCHESVNQFLLEAILSMFQTVSEQILGESLTDGRVIFSYPQPEEISQYHQKFRSPVEFKDQEFSEYLIPLSKVNTANPTKDKIVREQAERECDESLLKMDVKDSLSERVIRILNNEDSKILGLQEVSQLLNLSPRSLIRKLKQENTSYQSIVDEKNKQLSISYLRDEKLSIEAIASILGYEYVANFRRAFKRWFGITPSEYRKQFITQK